MKPNEQGGKASAATTRTRLKGLGATALKATGWILAVPALCAAVIVAGAVPLYLLLPDSTPPSAPVATADTKTPDAPRSSNLVTAPKEAEPVSPADEVEALEPVEPAAVEEAVSPPPAEAAASGEVPAEAVLAEAPAKPVHLGVMPTPRPAVAVAATAPKPEPAAAMPVAPAAGGSDRVSRAVTLRDGPRGRKLGVLPQGTEVAVLRCDGWCEVRSAEGDGWVHSSFLAGRAERERAPTRMVERPRRDEPRMTRREQGWREREEWRERDDPDWMLPDDNPMAYADDPRDYDDDDPYPYR